jgi:hypothetical protein
MRLTDISPKDCMGLFHRRGRRGRKEIEMGVEPSCGGDWDTRSTCDLLGEERAERGARDPPDNFADQDSDAAVRSCVWPAPGVHKAHIELAGGRSRSRMSLIIPDDQQPFYPDLRERIKVGDELLVVAPEDQRGKIEDRLRDVASVVGSPAHATDEERVRRFDVAVRLRAARLPWLLQRIQGSLESGGNLVQSR